MHDIGGEHRKVGPLSHFDAAPFVLLKRRVGRIQRHRAECLLAGQALFQVPVVVRKSIEGAARHGGIELDHGLAALHRGVGSGGQDRPRTQQRLPGIGAGQPRRPEPLRRKIQITDRMRRLHRGDDPQFREARDVRGVEHLRMLDAPARLGHRPLGRRHCRQRLLIEIEHQPVAPVADGVGLDLDAFSQCRDQERSQFVR